MPWPRIHWGSSVTVSPGVIIDLVVSLGRFEGGDMSMSPSESEESWWAIGAGGAAAVIVNVIVFLVRSLRSRGQDG